MMMTMGVILVAIAFELIATVMINFAILLPLSPLGHQPNRQPDCPFLFIDLLTKPLIYDFSD